jgi:hypothetical protein
MGISRSGVAFLAAAGKCDVEYGRTLTLGRQELMAVPRALRVGMREGGIELSSEQSRRLVDEGQGYCEPVLRYLGADVVDSIDASDFEGSTLVHDFNLPLPDELKQSYTAVIDLGTLEHVFNFPEALKSSLEAVAVGGHYLAVTPANGWAGHGFYQFTPELFFRALSEQNGFRVRCLLWRAGLPSSSWYSVTDPVDVHRRVERGGLTPASLYVVAQRTAAGEIFAEPPQQSDYVAAWSGSDEAGPRSVGQRVRALYRRLPEGSRVWLRDTTPTAIEETWGLVRTLRSNYGRGSDFPKTSLRELKFAGAPLGDRP